MKLSKDFRAIPAKTLARWFVNHTDRASGDSVTQLKLQKLVYYTEAWFMVHFDRTLTTADFEAWAHGPAIRALYGKYRAHGWDGLPPEKGPEPHGYLCPFLEAVYNEYGQFSAKRLERMTHEEDPWVVARGGLPPEAASRNVMPKLNIRNYYAKRIGKEPIKKLKD